MKTDLASKILGGDIRAAARLIRWVEDEVPGMIKQLKEIYPCTGKAYVVGITGAPGVGKSTLVDGLISFFREQNKSIGVVAIDPTSPITGGAILGDRVRMQRHSADEKVFIRSLTTRGSRGGLSRATLSTIHVMDAAGKDIIFVETVGTGQAETDVASLADTCIVVLTPGMGDEIQTIKAGILEIGDIFVINKGDRDGVEKLKLDLESMISMKALPLEEWKPPVLLTEAVFDKGTEELASEILRHEELISSTGELEKRRKERVKLELVKSVEVLVKDYVYQQLEKAGYFEEIVNNIMQRRTDPHSAALEIVKRCTKAIRQQQS
jgi:LAO/AO transport system kinase